MAQKRAYGIAWVGILLLAACQAPPSAPLPTLASAADLLPATSTPMRILPTLPPLVVGVPTPTPPRSVRGSYISPVALGDEVTGALSALSREHLYTYEGREGETLSLTLQRLAGTLDPVLWLYAPSGELLAQDEYSAPARTARLLNIRLPAEGLYQIVVGGDGFFGDYRLSLEAGLTVAPDSLPTAMPLALTPYLTPTLGAVNETTRLQDHVPVLGNLARPSDFARFSFSAQAGELISVGVEPYADSSLRPKVEVYDPDGVLIASAQASVSNAGGRAVVVGLPASLTGTYFVLVTAEDQTSGGAFVVSYGLGTSYSERFKGIAPPALRLDQLLDGRAVRDGYGVRLNAGDVITVAVTSEAFDPLIELSDSAGVVLTSDDNGGGGTSALIRTARIERTGDYLLRVRSARGDGRGAYTLLWRYVNLAPTPTPAPQTVTLMALDDSIAEGEYRFYAFQGRTDMRVRIRVTARAGSPLDPVAALLDPQGREIAQGDDSSDSLNPDFIVRLPADGSYRLRVNGYLSGGEYEVNVSALLD